MNRPSPLALICHPAARHPLVAIHVRATLSPDGSLALAYRLDARLDELRVPEPRPEAFADGLWEHTCFEAFVGVAGSRHYREFNFSPCGRWAAYGFADYRRRDALAPPLPAPHTAVRREPDCLELNARLDAALLPPAPDGSLFQVGLSAVVEAADGRRSYWALAHPGQRPDFHHRDGFTLALAPPASSPQSQP